MILVVYEEGNPRCFFQHDVCYLIVDENLPNSWRWCHRRRFTTFEYFLIQFLSQFRALFTYFSPKWYVYRAICCFAYDSTSYTRVIRALLLSFVVDFNVKSMIFSRLVEHKWETLKMHFSAIFAHTFCPIEAILRRVVFSYEYNGFHFFNLNNCNCLLRGVIF